MLMLMVLIYGLSSLLSSLDIRYSSICKLQIWIIYCILQLCHRNYIGLHHYTYTVIIRLCTWLWTRPSMALLVNGAKWSVLICLLLTKWVVTGVGYDGFWIEVRLKIVTWEQIKPCLEVYYPLSTTENPQRPKMSAIHGLNIFYGWEHYQLL